VCRVLWISLLFLAVATAGCARAGQMAQTTVTTAPASITVPTFPAVIPGYAEVDPATGLHVTGTPKVIDPAVYRLWVTGKVERALALTYDELRGLPKVTASVTLVCPGVFEDDTTWSGAALVTILQMAGVRPDAKQIRMSGADGHWVYLSLDKAQRPENFLAYEWMGQPLPVLHGFPLRAVVPGEYGSVWVKWLVEIKVE